MFYPSSGGIAEFFGEINALAICVFTDMWANVDDQAPPSYYWLMAHIYTQVY